MPEKCLIIFAFHIEKWNAVAAGKRGPRHIYITDISFKKCVRTRTGHHIFIFSVDCHCFNCRQKIDVIFKFNETKRSDKKWRAPLLRTWRSSFYFSLFAAAAATAAAFCFLWFDARVLVCILNRWQDKSLAGNKGNSIELKMLPATETIICQTSQVTHECCISHVSLPHLTFKHIRIQTMPLTAFSLQQTSTIHMKYIQYKQIISTGCSFIHWRTQYRFLNENWNLRNLLKRE